VQKLDAIEYGRKGKMTLAAVQWRVHAIHAIVLNGKANENAVCFVVGIE